MADKKGASKANQRQSSRHKNKYARYVTRSTCSTCRIIFKSPKFRLEHVKNDHKSFVGQSTTKAVKAYEPVFV